MKFRENVHPTLCVMCHVSRVPRHESAVTCHISKFFFLIFRQLIGQVGGAGRWRVCYQLSLPRLVLSPFPVVYLQIMQQSG